MRPKCLRMTRLKEMISISVYKKENCAYTLSYVDKGPIKAREISLKDIPKTCSEAEILIVQVQFLVRKFPGLGRSQDFHRLWVGQKVHRFHHRFIVLDREQNGDRFVPLGDQNAPCAPAEFGKVALRLRDGHYWIRSFHNRTT